MNQPSEITSAAPAGVPITRVAQHHDLVRKSGLRSLSRPAMQRCLARGHGNRLCGAPAMANGLCPRHGGKGLADHHRKHLQAARTRATGPCGTKACALLKAVAAYRTQHRLLRLVEALSGRSQPHPGQGVTQPGDPVSDRQRSQQAGG